jgi:hypothetical protein
LVTAAGSHDFAAFVLTPDDMVTKRTATRPAARDNVLFEAGLFIGAIGLDRVFLVGRRGDDLDIPTDLAGVTLALFKPRSDGRLRPALNPIAIQIRERISSSGPRQASMSVPAPLPRGPEARSRPLEEEQQLLKRELESLTTSALAQGWSVKTHSKTAYRLLARDGRRFSLSIGDPALTRDQLRPFADELSQYGLRFSRALLSPVDAPMPTAGPPVQRPKDPLPKPGAKRSAKSSTKSAGRKRRPPKV